MQNTDAVEPEDTPLLPESQRDTLRTSENINPRLVVALVTAVVFITTFGACLTSVPILRVVEDILCRRILQGTLPAGDIDESLCKRNDIQQDLATFMGVQSMLEAVPGQPQSSQEPPGRRFLTYYQDCSSHFHTECSQTGIEILIPFATSGFSLN